MRAAEIGREVGMPGDVAGRAAGPRVARRGDATVLVVEDNEILRELTAEMLQGAGYETLEADGSAAALALADSHAGAIDLLLCDVDLPGEAGPELARRLSARRPGLAVLFMSGYTEETFAGDGALGPGPRLLTKPFTFEQLTRKVREALGAAGPE